MNIQYKLTMDLMNPGIMPRVDVVQGDINSRTVELSVMAGEYLWKIPEGARIFVRYAKSDGTKGIYDTLPDGTAACTYHDNVIVFALAPQMLTAAGAVLAQIVIILEGQQLATFSMQINVNSDPSAGAATSEDYVNWMNDLIYSEIDEIFQTAKAAGELTGPSPTVEASRFSDATGSGVMLTVTNPGTGNQLPSQTAVPVMDGKSGVTPRFANVEVETVDHLTKASAEVSGATNALTLKMRIPRGEPGSQGDPPYFSIATAHSLPAGSQPTVSISGPPADLRLVIGIPDGPQGEAGKSPTITTNTIRATDGRNGVQINVNNVDGSMQMARVYDGKDAESVQPDWNQNDSTEPDFIKNRTHYTEMTMEKVTIEVESGSYVVDAELCAQLSKCRTEATYIVDGAEYNLGEEYGSSDAHWSYLLTDLNGISAPAVIYCDASGNNGIDRIAFRNRETGSYMAGTIEFTDMVETVHKLDPKYLPNGKPLVLRGNADNTSPEEYLNNPSYGDEALEAILNGRQILVRTPNADGGIFTAIYSPVYMYQLPNMENNYLYLFYLRDEKQDLSALLGQPAGTVLMPVYGQLKLLLSQTYNECPLE